MPREFLVFLALGAANTLLGLLLYWSLLRWLGHTAAYAMAYATGILFSAATNARYTFRSRLTTGGLLRFAAWTLGLYAFNALLLEGLVRGLDIDPRWAVLVVLAAAVPLGFLGARWTLKS